MADRAVHRAVPPADISAVEFFTRWVPESVARDAARHERLDGTEATIVFHLSGDGGGVFTISIRDRLVTGSVGGAEDPTLRVQVSVATWRQLNAGDLAPPEALLRRLMRIEGDLLLGLKLHLILGPGSRTGR